MRTMMKMRFYSLLALFFMISGRLFAEGEEAIPPPPDQGFWQTLVMIAIALMFFYVILWRPEQKRRKAVEKQRNTLKKGDRVVAMGIIGTVFKLGEQTIILKMYDGAKIEFFKSAITDVLSDSEGEDKKIETIPEERS